MTLQAQHRRKLFQEARLTMQGFQYSIPATLSYNHPCARHQTYDNRGLGDGTL